MLHGKLFGSGGRRSADGPVAFVEPLESRLCLSSVTTAATASVSAHQVHAAHAAHVAHVAHVRHHNHVQTVKVPIVTLPDFAQDRVALFGPNLA
jgi:hypothetical protein